MGSNDVCFFFCYLFLSLMLIIFILCSWSGAFIFVALFFFSETRSTIVLEKIAKKMRKSTGDKRFQAHVAKANMRRLIWISCTRPLRAYSYTAFCPYILMVHDARVIFD